MPDPESVVEFRGVSRRFGDMLAVNDVTFAIRRGEFFSLLGPSGCGKTTTLRLLAGFETPDAGEVRILGRVANRERPYERGLAMVFQNYALFPHLTVARNVAFGLEQRKVRAAEIQARVARALALVRLDPATYAARMPAQLSGGQRQRVALARALVLEPRILLLDEPLGALDLKLRKQMQLELKALNRELGVTFVYVTHDQEEALAMSDRIAVMHDGRIAQLGTPAEVYESPRTAFVADFIGEANFLGGRVGDGAAGLWTVTRDDGTRMRVPDHPALRTAERAQVAVRPEWLDLSPPGEAPRGENALAGTVQDVIYLGETMHVQVALGDGTPMRVAVRNEGQLIKPLQWRRGDACLVTWLPEDCQVLES
jgi:spermidine/putrescine transport system ATP-binding protein